MDAQWKAKPRVRVKDIGRKGRRFWKREAWTFLPQSNIPDEKVLVVERWRYVGSEGELARAAASREGDIEYRFGYFTVGRIGNRAGRWTWGQFAPLIPAGDLAVLLDAAVADGTIRKSDMPRRRRQ